MPGEHVGDGESHWNRSCVIASVPAEPGDSTERLREQILSRLLRPGSFAAVAGDRAVDQARVDLADGIVIEPELLQDAGSKIANHDIGFGNELANASEIIRVFEVGG